MKMLFFQLPASAAPLRLVGSPQVAAVLRPLVGPTWTVWEPGIFGGGLKRGRPWVLNPWLVTPGHPANSQGTVWP